VRWPERRDTRAPGIVRLAVRLVVASACICVRVRVGVRVRVRVRLLLLLLDFPTALQASGVALRAFQRAHTEQAQVLKGVRARIERRRRPSLVGLHLGELCRQSRTNDAPQRSTGCRAVLDCCGQLYRARADEESHGETPPPASHERLQHLSAHAIAQINHASGHSRECHSFNQHW
jgi:hypothetical protein